MKITSITLVRLVLPLEPSFPAAWDPEPRRRFPATVVLVDTDEGVRGGPFLEFPFDPPGWTPARRDFMLAEPVEVSTDGELVIGDQPGLGIVLDDGALRRYRVS